jgi:gluconate 5-dehydrogenase
MLELWHRTIDTNLTSAYLLTREAARSMIPQKFGRIINVGSHISVLDRERMQAYTSSKHGLAGLTKSLAGELGRYGVTCNAIAPGYFLTDMIEPASGDAALVQAFTNVIASIAGAVPRRLAAQPFFSPRMPRPTSTATYCTRMEVWRTLFASGRTEAPIHDSCPAK